MIKMPKAVTMKKLDTESVCCGELGWCREPAAVISAYHNQINTNYHEANKERSVD